MEFSKPHRLLQPARRQPDECCQCFRHINQTGGKSANREPENRGTVEIVWGGCWNFQALGSEKNPIYRVASSTVAFASNSAATNWVLSEVQRLF